MYEITGKSLRYGEKKRKGNKNGDHFFYGELPEEDLLIAIVADGVTGRPCDWLASTLSVEKFMENFKKFPGLDTRKRIQESVDFASEAIINTEGECRRMISTLVLMVWNYEEDTCYLYSIGDSRIYKCHGAELDQLTIDDVHIVKKVIMTNLGKRTIESSGLTKAMGIRTTKMDIQKIDFLPGELLLLASDGYYGSRPTLRNDVIAIRKSEDMEAVFDEIFNRYELFQADDMTGIVVRNNNAV